MPTFRHMHGIGKKAEVFIELIEDTGVTPDLVVKNCLNCDHWSSPMQRCEKFNATPPPDIICYGCPQWENMDDEIPF